jgi:hypothetical protein
MIYFIQRTTGGEIKIGTTVRLSKRLRQLEMEYEADLNVLAIQDGGRETENELHQRFDHLRITGEWFEPQDDLMDFILTSCREWDGTDEKPDTEVSVKIDETIYEKARVVAAGRGVKLSELLNNLLQETLSKEISLLLREFEASQQQEEIPFS